MYQLIEEGSLKAEYIYNDGGQRTRKTVYQSDGITVDNITIYHYDQMGYLVTETDETGTLIKDYIWQEGMTPLAQIDNNGGTESIIYLYTDHLMTARLATDQNQFISWRWEGEAFGNTPAEELAGISVNLRFPGQYFDEETNLHYNWNRYYDPTLGRYITSDPIGLSGGVNTYLYANANPIIFIDQYGLYCLSPEQIAAIAGGIGGGIGGAVTGGITGAAAGPVGAITGAIGFGIAGAGLGFGAGAVAGGVDNPVAGAVAGGAIGSATGGVPGMVVGAAGGAVGVSLGGGAIGGAAGGSLGGIGGIASGIGGALGGLTGAIAQQILTQNNDCDDECGE